MRKILFYYPSNKKSNSLESILFELQKTGIEILVLTTCEKGDFHFELEAKGIRTFSSCISTGFFPLYYFRQFLFLINFCRKHKPEVIFSHLQHTNIIAVIAQYFISSKVIVFRHHFKFHHLSNDKFIEPNPNEKIFDIIINRLAQTIVVPSSGVYNGMKQYESVNMEKVTIIPYIYDFSKYHSPDAAAVNEIKQKFPCRLRLLMCSRLIDFKRHHIVFPVIKKLVQEENLDIKLLVLDEGPENENLEKYISLNGMQNHIFMLGFKTDFINFMAASDLLIHPSLTEASNSTVKEMGNIGKTVAVCKGVGDFNDYIEDGKNGFLMSPNYTETEVYNVIKSSYEQPENLANLGKNLRADVIKRFNLNLEIIKSYQSLLT